MLAAEKMTKARAGLILDQPFFGSLALRLPLVPDPTCKTMWTDGTRLGFNPAWVDTLTLSQTKGVIAHEIMHCALSHQTRRQQRDGSKWNTAADFAANAILVEAGFTLTEGAFVSPIYNGQSAEAIYNALPDGENGGGQGSAPGAGGQTPPPPAGQDGAQDEDQADPDPGNMGEVRDAPADTNPAQQEQDWKIAVTQAAQQARAMGNLPAGLARLAEEIKEPRVDWRAELRDFVETVARNDYNFARPNPRYAGAGFILPTLRNLECGALAVTVDTSGSIDNRLLADFAAEIGAILDELKPAALDVLYCDAKVHNVSHFEPGDMFVMAPKGGGGTDFRPAFDYVNDQPEQPAAMVFFTDLAGSFPDHEPEYPTLWLDACNYGITPPFGRHVKMS